MLVLLAFVFGANGKSMLLLTLSGVVKDCYIGTETKIH
jgi:hypothetical protein